MSQQLMSSITESSSGPVADSVANCSVMDWLLKGEILFEKSKSEFDVELVEKSKFQIALQALVSPRSREVEELEKYVTAICLP